MYAPAIGRVDIRAIMAAIGHLAHVHCLMGHMACTRARHRVLSSSFHGLTYIRAARCVARVNPRTCKFAASLYPRVLRIVSGEARGCRVARHANPRVRLRFINPPIDPDFFLFTRETSGAADFFSGSTISRVLCVCVSTATIIGAR